MIIRRLQRRLAQLSEIIRRLEDVQSALGRVELRQTAARQDRPESVREFEFRVFSQWGEDGIIQYLIHQVPISNPQFVEFGVQDYKESNTRFLLQHDNWVGFVLEASAEDVAAILRDPVYYRHSLTAVHAFVHRDNINTLLLENGVKGDIGLLSIDIDGNDYWIWEAIDCVTPRIIICEYDNLLGPERAVVSPYNRTFQKREAHYSCLYGGASLKALDLLATRKGYALVGSNSAGNNAFFVRRDLLGSIRAVTPAEAYMRARYRSSRDRSGKLTFLSHEESLKLIADLPLIDVETGATISVRDIAPGI
jgi:hypothetical protein